MSRVRERVVWSLSALLALAAASAILFQGRSLSAPPMTPKRFAVRLPDLRFVSDGRGFSLVPDGSGIVYLTATPENGPRIHLYTLADGVTRALGGTERAQLPTVSPDGKWVAFYRANRLMKVAIAGGPPVEVSAVPYLFGISWSRDDWIVFAGGSGLARVPAAGGEAQTLTTANHRPVVRHDGRFFVFSSDRTTPRSLFRQSTDGSGAPERLVNATLAQNVTSWSADGRWLAFTQTTPATRDDIWILALDAGSTPRPFVQSASSENQASFSPDGRWIAYRSDESGHQEVMIRSFPGDGPRKQVSTAGGETPAFSSDGKTLFYRVKDQLWAAPISTDPVLTVGPPSVAFELSDVPAFSGLPNYVISRTGDRVLAVKSLGKDALARDVQVVVNWFDVLRRPSGLLRESAEPAK